MTHGIKTKAQTLGVSKEDTEALWWVPWAGVRVGQGQPHE